MTIEAAELIPLAECRLLHGAIPNPKPEEDFSQAVGGTRR